jgi:hypothetical protein
MVMINAILDVNVWKETRKACPLGTVSCPKPNKAPVCSYINNQTLFGNEKIVTGNETSTVSLVSTFSSKGSHAHGGGWVGLKTTDCTQKPGKYAGCMTAPCRELTDKKVICECPVAVGAYQIGGEGKTCNEGIPSAALMAQKLP